MFYILYLKEYLFSMKLFPKVTYDKWLEIQREAHRIFINHFKLSEGQRVLVVCCGKAREVFEIRKIIGDRGSIVAIDIDGDAIRYAKNLNAKKGYKNIEFLHVDANEFYHEIQFDRICCLFGIHYMNNYYKTLLNWKKMLASDGLIGVATFLNSYDNEVIKEIYNFTKMEFPEVANINILPKTNILNNFQKNSWMNFQTFFFKDTLCFPDSITYWKVISKNQFFKKLKVQSSIKFTRLDSRIKNYIEARENKPVKEVIRIKYFYFENNP